MFNTVKPLLLVALMGAATSAFAQDEPAPADSDTTVTDEGLSLGTPANEEPQVGQPYIGEIFGDWAMRCLKSAGDIDPCQLYQLLNDADGNSVAEFSVFPLAEGSQAVAGATIVAPLETLLSEQLTLSVDGANPRRYPFTFCNAAGCVARVGFTAAEIVQMKAGNAATLRMVPAAAPDEAVVLNISLSGFTAGYENLKPVN